MLQIEDEGNGAERPERKTITAQRKMFNSTSVKKIMLQYNFLDKKKNII